MPYVNSDKPNCPDCNKSGLAILPVRYAVVPTIAGASLPASLGNKVTSVALKHHKYALRTLRKGYLYLYYEKHARGRHIKWEVYSVAEGGTLWKQLSIGAIQEITEIQCSRKAHLVPASVITIDTPEKCGRVWMAFSEHLWSAETFKDFAQDQKLRDRRMQTFAPAVWIKSRGYRHGLEANEANVNEIVEYKTGFAFSALGGTDLKTISQPDGAYDVKRLNHCSTRHPVTVRRDAKAELVAMMKKSGETVNGRENAPIIVALWDSVGITHELNGFRNDAVGWVKKYNEEREFQIDAAAAIEGAKTALADQAATLSRFRFNTGAFSWNADASRSRMQLFDASDGMDTAGRHREMDLCERWERDAKKRVPTHVARQRVKFLSLTETAWQARMSEIDKAAAPMVAPKSATARDALYERDPRAAEMRREAVTQSWDAYEPRIDRNALDRFLQHRHAMFSSATSLAEARTEDVTAWLSSVALQDAFLEFSDSNVADGESFTNTVGNLIFGMQSSLVGRKLIKKWVDSASVTENNLLWRCFSLNQKEGTQCIDKLLSAIAANKNTLLNERSFDQVKEATKNIAKVAQLAQKGLSLHNALRKDGIYRVPTGGIEKVLVTVGNLFLQPFIRKGIDTVAETLILGLLLARSGSQHLQVMKLLSETAKSGGADRVEALMALRMGTAIISNRFIAKKAAWDVLAKDADIPKPNKDPALAGGFNESKELAFGLVATILQSIYVWKLYSEVAVEPNNQRLRAELWAAGFSLGAGLADLFAIGMKSTNSLGDAALTFQALKLGGGLLSAASAWTILQEDYHHLEESREKGNDDIAFLYGTKSILGVVSGTCAFLNSISYTEPAFRLMARRFPTTIIGRVALIIPQVGAEITGSLLLSRAILMACGIYFTLAIIAIQLLIWRYSDDALQDWCDRCAFGRQTRNRFGTSKIQMYEFDNLTTER